ncbi:cell division cycle-related protein [Oleoguttula sp. CCFEE 5521]
MSDTSRAGTFICGDCNLTFTAKRAYRSHLKTKRHADNAGLAPPSGFSCQYCEQNFTRKEGPIRHLERNQCPKSPNPKRKHESLDSRADDAKRRACVGPRSDSTASDDIDEDVDSGYGGLYAREGAGGGPSIASSSKSPEDSTTDHTVSAGAPSPYEYPRKASNVSADMPTPVQLPPLSAVWSPEYSTAPSTSHHGTSYLLPAHQSPTAYSHTATPSSLTRATTGDSEMTETSWYNPAEEDEDDEKQSFLIMPNNPRSMSSPALHTPGQVFDPTAGHTGGEGPRPLSDAMERMSLKNVVMNNHSIDAAVSKTADSSAASATRGPSRFSLATSTATSDYNAKRLSFTSLLGGSSIKSVHPSAVYSVPHSRTASLLTIGSRSTMSLDEMAAPFASEVDPELRDHRGKGDQGEGRIRRKVFRPNLPSISSLFPQSRPRSRDSNNTDDSSEGLTLTSSNRADGVQWDLLAPTGSAGTASKGGKSHQLWVRALEDHSEDARGALTLRKGDEIQVLPHHRSGNGEWYGVNQDSKKGFFPRKHCAVLQGRLYHPTIPEEG